MVFLLRPLSEPFEKFLGGQGLAAGGQCRSPSHDQRPRSAAGILVGDTALLNRHASHRLEIVAKEDADRRRPHGTPVPGVWCRPARFLPHDPREQSLGGRASPRSGTDRTPALEQGADPATEVRRIPSIDARILQRSSRASCVSSLYWPNAKSG